MRKKAIISIEGHQSGIDGEEDVLSFTTIGEFSQSEDEVYVQYSESELTGLEGTNTELKITPKAVTMSRTGKAPLHLIFEPGHKYRSLYQVPEGAFEMGISTHHLKSDFTSAGGVLEMKYATEFEHVITGENVFRIEVKEAGHAEFH